MMWRGGIDEAGRGCVCGGLFIAGVVGDEAALERLGAMDSKKLSPKRREDIYQRIYEARERGELDFHIVKKEAWEIDERGLSWAMRSGVEEIISVLSGRSGAREFVLDGNSTFSAQIPSGVRLETMVKGDDELRAISCASILAKVSKDRQMLELDRLYPHYGLAQNKGYGSAAHIEAIRAHGYCPHHRKSYKIAKLTEQGSLFD